METLGQYLIRERKMREIDLEEIINKTRIRRNYLQALEKDELEMLPPRPFVYGFLKAYAQYVGLDGDDLVTRYVDQLQSDEQQEEELTPASKLQRLTKAAIKYAKRRVFIY